MAELPRPPKGGARAPEPDWKALLAPALAGHDIGLLSEAGLPAVADPGAREAVVHKPEPNLNILHPRVLIPVLTTVLQPGTHVLACVVGAGAGQPEALPEVKLVLEGPGAPYVDAGGRHPIVWG